MKELVEYVARSLVDNKDAVTVEETVGPEATILELHVAPEDMGKVIGKHRECSDIIVSTAWAAWKRGFPGVFYTRSQRHTARRHRALRLLLCR